MNQLNIGTAVMYVRNTTTLGVLVNPSPKRVKDMAADSKYRIVAHGEILLQSPVENVELREVDHLIVWINQQPLCMLSLNRFGGYSFDTSLVKYHLQNNVRGQFVHHCNVMLFKDGSNPAAIEHSRPVKLSRENLRVLTATMATLSSL